MDDLTEEEKLLFRWRAVAADLASICRTLSEADFSVSKSALEELTNAVMVELWDQGFSQTQIRDSFLKAAADVSRYAAGQEQRGTLTPLDRR